VVDISDHITGMPVHLRPVPSTRPDPTGRGLAYRACRQQELLTTAQRAEVFDSLGLRPGRDRLMLLPISQWQHPIPEILGDPRQQVTVELPHLLIKHLRKLPANTHLVVVGNPLAGFHELPAEQVRFIDRCEPGRFNDLIGAADMMLSLHLPSQTLARAVFAGTAAFAMCNSFAVTGPADLEGLAAKLGGLSPDVRRWLDELGVPMYPFHSWPWRLTSMVEPMLADNPLLNTLIRAEILDEFSFVGQLEALLNDPATREQQAVARAAYVERVNQIPTIDLLLPDLLYRLA
jgi:hypothetical protein